MKGKILDFSSSSAQGVISGDDGKRYAFNLKDWKSSALPEPGARVDYETEGHGALAIYLDPASPKPTSQASGRDDPAYDAFHSMDKDASRHQDFYTMASPDKGFYRSSDDQILAGVCAGLAHRWKVNTGGLRFATCVMTLFFWVLVVLYLVFWQVFPARPTKNKD